MEKPSRERLTKLFNIDFKQRSFSLLLIETNLQSVLSNPDPFIPIIFPRIALNDLILGMHFIPKDFKVDKPSSSFNTSTKVVGEDKQPITIPLSSPKHTSSAQGSASITLTNLPLLVPNSDSIKQNKSIPLIAKYMDDTKGEASDIFNQVREKKKD